MSRVNTAGMKVGARYLASKTRGAIENMTSIVVTITGIYPGLNLPRVPWHEVAGRIEALGNGVSKWKIGQRIGVGFFGGQDGVCEPWPCWIQSTQEKKLLRASTNNASIIYTMDYIGANENARA